MRIIVWGIGVAIFFVWICVTAYLVIVEARRDRGAPVVRQAALAGQN